jgi:putative ABC transport system permease protein
MERFLQDIRYALRMLRKSPGFTAVAVLTLALGIGANTAIFSVVNAVLIRPLPYQDADRLVIMSEKTQQGPGFSVAYANFLDWREQNQAFEEVAAFQTGWSFKLTGGGIPERIMGSNVSANFFVALHVRPILGREFQPEEDSPGTSPVVILSYGLWQRRFGADPGLIGKALTLNGQNSTVVGILPPGFRFYQQADVFLPIGLQAEGILKGRGNHNGIFVLARRKPEVTMEEARAQMDTIARRLEQQYPETNTGHGVKLESLRESIVANARTAIFILFCAVGFVLLIACANVTNLLLARSTTREKEMSIRAALGASRLRVIRQLLTESLLLSLAGGVLGLLLGTWGFEGLMDLVPQDLHPLAMGGFGIDYRVLGFTLLVVFFTATIFGMAPALQASKPALQESLKEGGRISTTGLGRNRFRNWLIVAEVGLALVLLISAGLLIKSFQQLLLVDPGFDPQNVLTMHVPLSESNFSSPAKIAQTMALNLQLEQTIQKIPGVISAATVWPLPFGNNNWFPSFYLEGRPLPKPDEFPVAEAHSVSPNFFQVMHIPLLKGRYFSERDVANALRVVVINKTMAQRYWPNEDPLGKRFRLGRPDLNLAWVTVVGIVGDTKFYGLDAAAESLIYLPSLQEPQDIFLVVRTASNPLGLAAAARKAVLNLDQDQPVDDIQIMEQRMSESVASRRVNMWLLGIFAVLALSLALVGVYGMMSYSVAQRTHEIGLRLALGAQPGDVLFLVVGRALLLAMTGVGVGLAGAFALTRFLSSLLFGVRPTDPLIFIGISILLTSITLLASYIPARRATKVDPMVALRYE